MRLSEKEFRELKKPRTAAASASRSKFRNTKCEYDGRKFDSKRERDYYIQLERQKAAKLIRGFAHQVSIPLASGKRRMRIDFMVVEIDGRISWRDSKGHVTPEWETKRVELQHALGIRIDCV